MDYFAILFYALVSVPTIFHGLYVGSTWYRCWFVEGLIEPKEDPTDQYDRFEASIALVLVATLFSVMIASPAQPNILSMVVGGCEGVIIFFAAEGALAIGQRLSYRKCEERISKFQSRTSRYR